MKGDGALARTPPPFPLPAAKQQKPRMQFLLPCWLRAGLPFGAIRARLRHDKKKARRCAQEYLTGGQVQSHILVWSVIAVTSISWPCLQAAIAQLGERQTEDLKVPGSIPGLGMAVWSLVNKLRVFSTGNGSTMWHTAEIHLLLLHRPT